MRLPEWRGGRRDDGHTTQFISFGGYLASTPYALAETEQLGVSKPQWKPDS
jgi:hypothetical protein